MAIEKVRAHFAQFGIADRVREFEVSSATVELAAQALKYSGFTSWVDVCKGWDASV